MKPDPDYTKRLLTAFQDAPDPTTDIRELVKRGLTYEAKEFRFHMRLLNDQGFIERDDGKPGIGMQLDVSGEPSWSVVQLRLTASGHDFAAAMNNNRAFEAVKKAFAGASLSFMRDIAMAALKAGLGQYGLDLGH